MRDTAQQFSKITVVLHWLVALAIITLLAVGIYMTETETYSLYPIHKSVGVIIFVFVLTRVVWRVINGWPKPVGTYQAWEHVLAKIVHWVLIVASVLMPASGMMMSGAGGHGIAVFGVELLARNPDPANPQKVMALNESLAGLGHNLHGIIGYVLVAAILLHVAGALKHHIVDGDGTLKRMLGKKV